MCGVSGIMYKTIRSGEFAPIGADLIKMLESLTHRGQDSSGVTVAGEPPEADLIIRLWSDDDTSGTPDALDRCQEVLVHAGGVITSSRRTGRFLRITANYEGEVPELTEALLGAGGVALHSVGRVSEVVKDVGPPAGLDLTHEVSQLRGTHGIGHVRMATESRVDIGHAHPFWAYPFPDVTVVHNGQLTNYHKLQRALEDRGHQFQTENDSEVIAVFLADKLARGDSLEQALEDSVERLDGTFSYLVSTENALGYAKDRWSAKPLVTMETDDVIAIASEEVALKSVFDEAVDRIEPQESEVMTWSL